jgi:hypothetical protein
MEKTEYTVQEAYVIETIEVFNRTDLFTNFN